MQRAAGQGRLPRQDGAAQPRSKQWRRSSVLPVQAVIRDAQSSGEPLRVDPDEPLRRYGSLFGKSYTIESPMSWIEEAPRVRVRSVEDRKLDELLELAVVNERLSGATGMKPWQVRARLEHIKLRRRNWEAIYHYITQTDAVATLGLIEELNARVSRILPDLRPFPTCPTHLRRLPRPATGRGGAERGPAIADERGGIAAKVAGVAAGGERGVRKAGLHASPRGAEPQACE